MNFTAKLQVSYLIKSKSKNAQSHLQNIGISYNEDVFYYEKYLRR